MTPIKKILSTTWFKCFDGNKSESNSFATWPDIKKVMSDEIIDGDTLKKNDDGLIYVDSSIVAPDEIVYGYYKVDDNDFYYDEAFTDKITPIADTLYFDKKTEVQYHFTGSGFFSVSTPVSGQDVITALNSDDNNGDLILSQTLTTDKTGKFALLANQITGELEQMAITDFRNNFINYESLVGEPRLRHYINFAGNETYDYYTHIFVYKVIGINKILVSGNLNQGGERLGGAFYKSKVLTADNLIQTVQIITVNTNITVPVGANYFVVSRSIDSNLLNDFVYYDKSEKNLVVCWGDSLTENGYYATKLNTLLGNNYRVIAQGSGGDSPERIAARNGACPALITTSFTIPSSASTLVPIDLPTCSMNGIQEGFLYMGAESLINPCIISGIECTLSITYDAGFTNPQMYVKRNYTGDVRNVYAGEPIIMNGSILYNKPEKMVIFAGTNGLTMNNYVSFAEAFQAMMSYSNCQNTIIISPYWSTSTTDESVFIAFESLLTKLFGQRHINLRRYLYTNAIYDAVASGYLGAEVITEAELLRMSNHLWPLCLVNSSIDNHLNSVGYNVLGDLIYKRMVNISNI